MRFILFISFLLITIQLNSQVVTTEPPFATRNDSFVVIFNAAEGDQGLMGYSGTDVYAHTGVTIKGVGTWQYVNADWTDNLPHRKLSRIEGDLWKLVIGDPYEYYDVPANQIITQLSFVFKNSTQSVTGRDVGGADIFMDLYEPGLTVEIIQPSVNVAFGDPRRSPYFTNANDEVDITAVGVAIGTEVALIDLYVDGESIASAENDTLLYSYNPGNNFGIKNLKIVATDTSGLKDSTVFAIMVNPPLTTEARPQGIVDGINYVDDNTVILSLMAPYKDNIYIVGDFNDWMPDENYFMKREWVSVSENHWWIELTGLQPGTEYAFQYLVDGDLRVADPYSEKILDQWNDQYISAATYPNLKAYPYSKTDQPVTVIETSRQPYSWEATDYQAPPREELIVYELLIRDFLNEHTFSALADTLDYLQKLGINAIELMPVNEFEGNSSWGYNPSFYFAVDKYYGPAESFKKLVDECHKRDMAVIMDMVLNHAYGQCPLVRLYLTAGQPDLLSPWFNREAPHTDFAWGYDFDHESPFTQQLVDSINSYWMTEYKVDGFRFDFTRGFTNKAGSSGPYDQSRIDILKRMADAIWSVNPDAYVILEHLVDDNNEMKTLAEYGMLLWGNMNYNYNEATMGWISNSDLSGAYYKTRGWNVPHLVSYMESHDEERLMFKNISYGNSSGDYDIQDPKTALQRIKLAAAFFLTLPGPKMVWQFGELGFDLSINWPSGEEYDRLTPKPAKWDYYQDADRKKLYRTFAALLKLRQETQLFRDAESTVSLSLKNAVKRINISGADMDAAIIGNFSVIASDISPNFSSAGTWYDFFSGDSIDVTDTSAPIALAPGEFHIYTSEKVESPEDDPVTALTYANNTIADEFQIAQNYPNPFNPNTTIEYSLNSASQVEIIIYDIRGRRIQTFLNEKQNAGSYSIKFTAENLASGVYYYTFKAGSFIQTRKMVVLK